MKTREIRIDHLVTPAEFQREQTNTREDEQLTASIRNSGIQQPLVVVASEDEENFEVIDGTRRLAIARSLGIPKLLCVVREVPDKEDRVPWMRMLRFIIDEKRQDLLPSQRADIIRHVMDKLGMSRQQVADYLGISSDTIGNYLAIHGFIPQARTAIDSGRIKVHAARALVGMTEAGQEMVLRKHEKEFQVPTRSTELHRRLRSLYPPEKHPTLYKDAKQTAALMARPRTKRVTKNMSHEEKSKLINDVSMQQAELETNKEELKRIHAACVAAAVPIQAIVNNPRLHDVKLVSPAELAELKEFLKNY